MYTEKKEIRNWECWKYGIIIYNTNYYTGILFGEGLNIQYVYYMFQGDIVNSLINNEPFNISDFDI